VDAERVSGLVAGGDTRWIHRAAYDLMDYQPAAVESASGMSRGISLYGSLPHQLADEKSFASRLRRILDVRRRSGIATARQLSVPEVSDPALLVMIHRLPQGSIQATVLNFSGRPISARVGSDHFERRATVIDLDTNQPIGEAGADRTIDLWLDPHAGVSLLVTSDRGA
jgi:hypothetical protein